MSLDVMMVSPSWIEVRVESPREESGEDIVVAGSMDVGGAEDSRVAEGEMLICIFDMPSLSVAMLAALCNLDDFNELSPSSTKAF